MKVFFIKLIILLCSFTVFGVDKVCAKDLNKENPEDLDQVDILYEDFANHADFEDLEDELNFVIKKNYDVSHVSFQDVYELLLKGKLEEAILITIDEISYQIIKEVKENQSILIKLVLLVIIAAIFNNYSSIYKFSYIGEQGFYITYLMIAVLMMQSFSLAYEIAEETVICLKEMMDAMLPAFYMSISLCCGYTTSYMINAMLFWMLTFIEKILLTFILPFIRIYFLIILLNQINVKDRFSKLALLIKQGIQFSLKSIVTGIIGLNIMKSILIPIMENTKYNMIKKGISMLPGGSTFSGLTTILLGASVLIKNSIGLTVVLILLIVASIPLLKLFCFYVIYRLILAFIQPISDHRILSGIQGASDSLGILLRATSTSVILSILSIAIIVISTNARLYIS